ncbi:acetyl-coenzyme A synthetase, partial [Francisella tularensis subsp. holarctica]|uniref:AMP-binding enzyme n=1 Tax=Francisella tularensis TaxID=263 RepID=UPI0023AE31BC|nr:acetyl-coenzyme A synthetase [Francisella tularensis subsp. holarctica]
YVNCILKEGKSDSKEAIDEDRKSRIKYVRQEIGPFATPEVIQFTPELPKTRSGKIMRRILIKIAAKYFENFVDTSTLLNPDIVD